MRMRVCTAMWAHGIGGGIWWETEDAAKQTQGECEGVTYTQTLFAKTLAGKNELVKEHDHG